MIDEKKRLERRTVQYWFEDGIWEMGIGAMSLWIALYFLIETIIPPRTLWRVLWGVTAIPVFFLGAKFMARAVRSSKEKWTYPRTGFISYRRQNDLKRSRRFSWPGSDLRMRLRRGLQFLEGNIRLFGVSRLARAILRLGAFLHCGEHGRNPFLPPVGSHYRGRAFSRLRQSGVLHPIRYLLCDQRGGFGRIWTNNVRAIY